jgi:hypothetical protein
MSRTKSKPTLQAKLISFRPDFIISTNQIAFKKTVNKEGFENEVDTRKNKVQMLDLVGEII